ncbi:rare lipoprotein A [Oceanisphaera litoralis]|uniref:septal ring lytic transglycosylase RlpA family protein n=1 Tax=Oceanisphaera litoralis TaxID=225144 RepID=UPI0019583BCF|nr:septal ring lytic transglycosylase RlpA family protein [Oceanisphaera litoralis]MBM7455122.1 rare lipoprotein A [Oceanisphaera litoralis]
MNRLSKSLLPLAALGLAACSSQPEQAVTPDKQDAAYDRETAGGRYALRQDKPPANAPDMSQVKNAVPRFEPYSRRGNRDYNVWGSDYQVWNDVKHYRDEGLASWYGAKFHGYETSNGEIYDMYTMTAAHKNLPLPSFVKVINVQNGKQVIVRVNDRGPFHGDRIIDLSYAAAYKLDMLDTGTAQVRVELLRMAPDGQSIQLAADDPQTQVTGTPLAYRPTAGTQTAVAAHKTPATADRHIQLLATRSADKAKELAARLTKAYGFPARVEQSAEWYRLQMGPIPANKMEDTLSRLVAEGYAQAYFLN